MAFDPIQAISDAAGFAANPFGVVGKVDDVLDKDQKTKLSAVLARNGWGPANSRLNGQARAIVHRECPSCIDGGDQKSKAGPCSSKGDFAFGPFQLCSVHKGNWGSPKDIEGFGKWASDPDNAAKGARALHRAGGWQPWATSGPIPPDPTSWDPEVTTDKDSLSGGAAEAVGAAVSPFTGIAAAATDLIGSLLSADTWFRIGKGWLGFVFVVTGTGALVFIIANQASGGKAGKVAKTVAIRKVVK